MKFGTSGLRGPAITFTNDRTYAYAGAFLGVAGGSNDPGTVYVGADLRSSSPRIAAAVIAAVKVNGWRAVYAGQVPTPALAAYALARDCPAIMVTGSHVPETYNGLKFYRPDGELLKEDEGPIARQAEQLMERFQEKWKGFSGSQKRQNKKPGAGSDSVKNQKLLTEGLGGPAGTLPLVNTDIARAYVARYVDAFGNDVLKGLRIGIDLHSAAGRDLIVEVLEALGAYCVPFRRLERFVAVDTEALSQDDISRAKRQLAKHRLDAVVSTDGDGDRPLLIDERGDQVNGDVLGALTARALGIKTVVTPVSSTSAIEQCDWFDSVIRTRIGSPYVVAAMNGVPGKARVAGFEANGGFLLGTDIVLARGVLARLPTRDALLPLVAVLGECVVRQQPVSGLAAGLPARYMKADRVKNIPEGTGRAFLEELAVSATLRASIDPRLAEPVDINITDGVRMVLGDANIVHVRQSGNAPEMRCYVETAARHATGMLLNGVIEKLAEHLFSRVKTDG